VVVRKKYTIISVLQKDYTEAAQNKKKGKNEWAHNNENGFVGKNWSCNWFCLVQTEIQFLMFLDEIHEKQLK